MSDLKRRLLDTESQMTRILQAMETVQQKVQTEAAAAAAEKVISEEVEEVPYDEEEDDDEEESKNIKKVCMHVYNKYTCV